jgi:NitT/TauT family transport system permease protein
MTVQDTSHAAGLAPLDVGTSAPAKAAAKPARRLPVQKDWPTWAIVATQFGILVVIIAAWEIAATTGLISAFFWSQPSAIWHTLIIFVTEGDAWVDIGFTFRSTIFGFLLGTTVGSVFGLSFW